MASRGGSILRSANETSRRDPTSWIHVFLFIQCSALHYSSLIIVTLSGDANGRVAAREVPAGGYRPRHSHRSRRSWKIRDERGRKKSSSISSSPPRSLFLSAIAARAAQLRPARNSSARKLSKKRHRQFECSSFGLAPLPLSLNASFN